MGGVVAQRDTTLTFVIRASHCVVTVFLASGKKGPFQQKSTKSIVKRML